MPACVCFKERQRQREREKEIEQKLMNVSPEYVFLWECVCVCVDICVTGSRIQNEAEREQCKRKQLLCIFRQVVRETLLSREYNTTRRAIKSVFDSESSLTSLSFF